MAVASLGSSTMNAQSKPTEPPVTFSSKPKPTFQTKHLTIGCLVFPRQDQIDFTGPFEVFSRIPNSTVHVIAKTKAPVRDVKGLILTPEMTLAEVPPLGVLLVSGGLGQQALMDDEEILSLIRRQADSGRLVFSVCTGALLCGAAGILRDRPATTHWAAWDLLHYYGAIPAKSRVVVDGNYISTAGVTAGLDGALVVASLLRGDHVAEEIQLDIEYAPEPVFHSGTPNTATPEVIRAFFASYGQVKGSREAEAQRFSRKLGVSANS
jgi:cyclohexyl-isocyanide hydratase